MDYENLLNPSSLNNMKTRFQRFSSSFGCMEHLYIMTNNTILRSCMNLEKLSFSCQNLIMVPHCIMNEVKFPCTGLHTCSLSDSITLSTWALLDFELTLKWPMLFSLSAILLYHIVCLALSILMHILFCLVLVSSFWCMCIASSIRL